ncbi:hypothetical protein, partial [Ilumatobacter nonamiensis]|uniref:hypothetical protein n=1 Tax=Ilumatobacter nonamiensis TaxID=467093 RepID=UPI00058FF3B0
AARVGSIRTGLVLIAGRPAFALTAHDCTVNGTPHALLDLSSPDAALDAADAVIGTVLTDLLATFGRTGELVAILIGLDPPAGPPISVPELLADPLATLRTYWSALVSDLTDLAVVVTAARELLTGAVDALPGSGSAADPWRIGIDPADVLVWVEGSELRVDLRVDASVDFLDDLAAVVTAQAAIVRLDFAASTARFLDEVRATLSVQRRDEQPARLDLGPVDLAIDRFTIGAAWHARNGLRAVVEAPGAALELAGDPATTVDDVSVGIPLPVVAADGTVSFDPDWDDVEVALSNLLARTGAPIVDALIDLVGWSGFGARLRLAEVLADPAAALRAWLADMVLDCGNARLALTPAAVLLSGGRLGAPLGSGNPFDRFRAPVAGEPLAPGLAAWFDPGCAIPRARYEPLPGFFDTAEAPEPGELVAALHAAATVFPELADLLVARDGLDQGFAELTARMVGTDGLLGRPVALPDGVTGIDVESYGYRELVALGATHTISFEVLDAEPAAVLYLGVEDVWASAFDAASIDARAAAPTATVPATSSGPHSVALPTVEAADADRPDRGGIGEQAERIVAALGDRTDPITIIAYGAAGAAALTAASDPRIAAGVIERIVTVGAPWGPVATTAFTTGLSGDALRFLDRAMRPVSTDPDDQLTEELIAGELSPGLRTRLLLDRAIAAAGIGSASLGELPDASLPEPPAGVPIDAVFGLLDADTIELGLAEVVAEAIAYRYELAVPPPPPESLHVGVDLPVLDASIGGVHVGAGVTLELVEFDRGPSGDSFVIHDEQTVIVDLQFGITDGWLVGGPGAAQDDVEVRWVSARTWLPLGGDDADARTEIVLHEARCFGVERARWVIDADADGIGDSDVTLTTPEVHILVGEVIARLSSASTDLAELFDHVGLRRDGGYDPQGLDRLVLDTAQAVRDSIDSASAALAAAIRRLAGLGGTGTELTRTVDTATIQLDLATRSIAIAVSPPAGGLVPAGISVHADPGGLDVTASLGEVDPVAGGIALAAGIQTTGASVTSELCLRHRLPGELADVELTPANLTASALTTVAGRLVSAALVRGLVEHLRGRLTTDARTAIEAILDGLELLTDAPIGGQRGVRVPWAMLADPGGWLTRVASPWIADPFAQAIGVLDALRPIVAPTAAPGEVGWPLGPDVTIGYAVADGRLQLTASVAAQHDLDGADLRTTFTGGISLAPDGLVAPTMGAAVTFDGNGVRVAVDPQPRIDLVRPAPAAPVPILPAGAGLAGLLDTAAGMAIPLLLNAVIDERDNAAASLRRDVARVVFDLGTGLDL